MTGKIYALAPESRPEKDPATLAGRPETDQFGRVIFRTDQQVPTEIDPNLIQSSLATSVATIRDAIAASGVKVSEIKLKFAIDAKVGLAFVGNTGIEASVEIKLSCE